MELNEIRFLDKHQLLTVLKKGGYDDIAAVLNDRNINGQQFLELSEFEIINWKLSPGQLNYLFKFIKEVKNNPSIIIKNDSSIRRGKSETNSSISLKPSSKLPISVPNQFDSERFTRTSFISSSKYFSAEKSTPFPEPYYTQQSPVLEINALFRKNSLSSSNIHASEIRNKSPKPPFTSNSEYFHSKTRIHLDKPWGNIQSESPIYDNQERENDLKYENFDRKGNDQDLSGNCEHPQKNYPYYDLSNKPYNDVNNSEDDLPKITKPMVKNSQIMRMDNVKISQIVNGKNLSSTSNSGKQNVRKSPIEERPPLSLPIEVKDDSSSDPADSKGATFLPYHKTRKEKCSINDLKNVHILDEDQEKNTILKSFGKKKKNVIQKSYEFYTVPQSSVTPPPKVLNADKSSWGNYINEPLYGNIQEGENHVWQSRTNRSNTNSTTDSDFDFDDDDEIDQIRYGNLGKNIDEGLREEEDPINMQIHNDESDDLEQNNLMCSRPPLTDQLAMELSEKLETREKEKQEPLYGNIVHIQSNNLSHQPSCSSSATNGNVIEFNEEQELHFSEEQSEYSTFANDIIIIDDFYRNTTRTEAKSYLRGLSNGAFLFRPSKNYFLALTLKYQGKYYNLGIDLTPENKIRICANMSSVSPKFEKLSDFIEYFITNPITFKSGEGPNSTLLRVHLNPVVLPTSL